MGHWVVVLGKHHYSPTYLHCTDSLQQARMVANSVRSAFHCHAWIEGSSQAWSDAAMSARELRVYEHRKQIGAQ
jgi:hypothetical protein